jgi:hypothetical protein
MTEAEDFARSVRSETRLDAIEGRQAEMAADIKAILAQLNEAQGGLHVMRWLGFGTLAGGVAVAAALYSWLQSFVKH